MVFASEMLLSGWKELNWHHIGRRPFLSPSCSVFSTSSFLFSFLHYFETSSATTHDKNKKRRMRRRRRKGEQEGKEEGWRARRVEGRGQGGILAILSKGGNVLSHWDSSWLMGTHLRDHLTNVWKEFIEKNCIFREEKVGNNQYLMTLLGWFADLCKAVKNLSPPLWTFPAKVEQGNSPPVSVSSYCKQCPLIAHLVQLCCFFFFCIFALLVISLFLVVPKLKCCVAFLSVRRLWCTLRRKRPLLDVSFRQELQCCWLWVRC